MAYIRLSVYSFLLCIFISGCSNELHVNTALAEHTFITGILQANTDTNYIRIEKSFLPESGNAVDGASVAENVFYTDEELEAFVIENNTGKKIWLDRIDGDSLGLPKDEGIFSYSPNIMYRFICPIDQSSTYSIAAILKNTDDTITATTGIVKSFASYNPVPGLADFVYNPNIVYSCEATGYIYELWMHFYYTEKDTLTGDSTIQELNWQIVTNEGLPYANAGNFMYTLTSASFYTFLRNNIPVKENIIRHFTGMKFTWYAGSREMQLAYENALVSLGITNGYNTPPYTNINGGSGIFSSMYVKNISGISLSPASWDTLACGIVTSKLKFLPPEYSPNYPGCK